jgi:Tol biopolymer transport system component
MRRGGTLVVLAVAVTSLAVGRSEATPTDRASAGLSAVENGRIAFVSSWAKNLSAEIFRVDVTSGRRTNLSRDPAPDNEAVVSPDGRTILFQSSRDNLSAIWAMNADGTQQRRLTIGESPAWAPDGKTIAFGFGEDVMLMAADGSDVRLVGHGQWPVWSADGRALTWVNRGSVFTASADGSGAKQVFSTTSVFAAPLWGPGDAQLVIGAELLLPSGGLFHGLVTVPASGGEATPLARVTPGNPASDISPTRSPNGARVAYVDRGRIRAVRVADGTQVALTRPKDGDSDSLPAWSPDGRHVAFLRLVDGRARPPRLFVVPSAGGAARQVAQEDAHAWFSRHDLIRWTRDGRSLVYSDQLAGNDTDIYTVDPDGAGRRRLTDNDVNDAAPAFSPDGRWLAFVRTLGKDNEELFVMRADGSAPRRLTRWPGDDLTPAWSPDGSQIVFVRWGLGDDPLVSLYTIRPDGTGLRRLRTPDDLYDSPSWSPDGRAIAVVRGTADVEGVGIGGELVVVRADGRGAQVIVEPGEEDVVGNPEWSPDGRTISFVSEMTCKFCVQTDLLTVRPDGSSGTHLLTDARDAAWAPDGARLVVLLGGLVIVTPSGRIESELNAHPGGAERGLSWQPLCTLNGGTGRDRLQAGARLHRVCGLAGNDTLRGSAGRDRLFGGEGDDRIDARGGGFDIVGCGPGIDRVVADRRDLVGVDCETVAR